MKHALLVLWLLIVAPLVIQAQSESKPKKVDVVYNKNISETSWLVTKVRDIYVVNYTFDDPSSSIEKVERGVKGGVVVTVKRDKNLTFTFCMPEVQMPEDDRSFIFWKKHSREEFQEKLKKIPQTK